MDPVEIMALAIYRAYARTDDAAARWERMPPAAKRQFIEEAKAAQAALATHGYVIQPKGARHG